MNTISVITHSETIVFRLTKGTHACPEAMSVQEEEVWSSHKRMQAYHWFQFLNCVPTFGLPKTRRFTVSTQVTIQLPQNSSPVHSLQSQKFEHGAHMTYGALYDSFTVDTIRTNPWAFASARFRSPSFWDVSPRHWVFGGRRFDQ
jgi:hypothetical protein